MDTHLTIAAAGGALLMVFVFQVFRSARGDMNDEPVSATWLADRKRRKEEE